MTRMCDYLGKSCYLIKGGISSYRLWAMIQMFLEEENREELKLRGNKREKTSCTYKSKRIEFPVVATDEAKGSSILVQFNERESIQWMKILFEHLFELCSRH